MKKRMLSIKSQMHGVMAAILLLTWSLYPGSLAHAAEFRVSEGTAQTDLQTEDQASESVEPTMLMAGCTSEGMDEETAQRLNEAGAQLAQLAAEREIMALVYLADEYPMRTVPSYAGDVALTVFSGQQVHILDFCLDSNYEIWNYVCLEYEDRKYYGYIPRRYLAVSDERFLIWEDEYGFSQAAIPYVIGEDGQAVYADVEQFPASYRAALTALKQRHPGWVFVKMNTTLDWNDVIRSEMLEDRSLVYKSLPDWAKDGLYDEGNWYYATEDAVKVYMDPRNALKEEAIFQFEQLTYNEQYHTLGAVQNFLNNTFMNGSKPAPGQTSMTYAELFWHLGSEEARKVSPFHLAARVLQEQGKGDSPLISGTYPGYEGYYNYFNIGAWGNTDKAVCESGLRYAKDHGWNGAYSAIRGGADFISANYIRKGQDTLYLQKFNVNPKGVYKPYTHQYMQNISAPTTEGWSIRRLYAGANALDSTFVFKIPVFENMPARPCAAPGTELEEPEVESFEITLELPQGYEGSTVWLDGVEYRGRVAAGDVRTAGKAVTAGAAAADVESTAADNITSVIITVMAADKNARTAVVYRYNEAQVPTGMYVWSLEYNSGSYSAVPEPELADLLSYHGFSVRITGKSGIRFKTGISAELKARLTAEGVNGYRLKEYGTLVMNNANREQYPMVKGGAKVQSGMAYGTDAGGLMDVVYETVSGRQRYTSVLVGMPAAQYRREFAFRGYIVLEKDGKEAVLYGPPVAKSIYALAQQLLEKGGYQPGSAAYEFLAKLIEDAEAA